VLRHRRLIAATLALAAFGVPASSAAAATDPVQPATAPTTVADLAVNGGFEAGLTGWRATSGATLSASASPRSGNGAANLSRPTSGTVMLTPTSQPLAGPAGSTCTAAAWIKGAAGRAARIRLREANSAGFLGDEVGTVLLDGTTWQRVSVQLPITAAASRVDLTVWGSQYPAGIVLAVDDVSVHCAPASVLFSDGFDRSPGLITNEFAYWNPTNPASVVSTDWEMNSGSLFARDGVAWSGVPDATSPDARSSTSTDSAVFRLNTRRFDFGDVDVALRLRTIGLTTTPSTPATAWDGVHLFLRHRSQHELYYASVNRRDGVVVVKKKCLGGATNGGTYYVIGKSLAGQPIPFGTWQQVAAGVRDNADGSVQIRLWREGVLLLDVLDQGIGCAPLTGAGATGVRADNAEIELDDFTVWAR
jgi:hypothetical protein